MVPQSFLIVGTQRFYPALAVARAIAHATERHSHLHIYLDKRYTNLKQQRALEQRIREALAHIPDQVVIIEQVDSTVYPGLQAVDFVAWAIRRKHEGDGAWAELIQHRVVVEELLGGKKIAAPPGGR